MFHEFCSIVVNISIHALRVEGDTVPAIVIFLLIISIHALRVEGDKHDNVTCLRLNHFYPRPPGGGRQSDLWDEEVIGYYISIHALRVEGDNQVTFNKPIERISIHALRVEGDNLFLTVSN